VKTNVTVVQLAFLLFILKFPISNSGSTPAILTEDVVTFLSHST